MGLKLPGYTIALYLKAEEQKVTDLTDFEGNVHK